MKCLVPALTADPMRKKLLRVFFVPKNRSTSDDRDARWRAASGQKAARFPKHLERCGLKAGAIRPAACSENTRQVVVLFA